ncbi:MAG: hypothetical protein AAGA21_05530 [Pseudomonadota bacterium]
MALKPGARQWIVMKQIVEDLATGLTFQFKTNEADESAPFHLKIFGELQFGNREIIFDANGEETEAGPLLADACHPSWIREVT